MTFNNQFAFIVTLFSALLISVAVSAEIPPDYTDSKTGMTFMKINGGTFMMGKEGDINAMPVHEVTVGDFYMGQYEVTFEQYAQYTNSVGKLIPNNAGWGFGERPIINVSWQEAVDFTQWLSEETGRTFRLPTESEWEFAARAGTDTTFFWGDELGSNNANCRDCGSAFDKTMTAPVGSFAPNPYGLLDMEGNVYEWLLDTFHFDYQGAPTDGSAWLDDPKKPGQRMNRSGSWYRPSQDVRPVTRCWDPETTKNREIGFRVVMEP